MTTLAPQALEALGIDMSKMCSTTTGKCWNVMIGGASFEVRGGLPRSERGYLDHGCDASSLTRCTFCTVFYVNVNLDTLTWVTVA